MSEEKMEAPKRRGRKGKPFPTCSFEEALELAQAIHKHAAGQPIRRLTLFDELGKSPESSTSRQWITNAGKYGLTKGGYAAESLELTSEGAKAVGEEHTERERAKARVGLAIEHITSFHKLFDRFQGNKLPSHAVLVDAAKEFEVPGDLANEAVDTFIVNLRFLGLLKTLSGADRIISLEHLLESLPAASSHQISNQGQGAHEEVIHPVITQATAHYETTCFYITPIGEEGSEQRQHSDLFLGSIVEPALEQFGLKVIRADSIDKPGTITRQIIDYILKSRLVVADLSYHNPNVFYELAIRHAARLPTVQIVRGQDRIPFDLSQTRTIKIDCTSIYTLVPQIESYRSQIASQVRRALEDPDTVDNPITTYYPSFKVEV